MSETFQLFDNIKMPEVSKRSSKGVSKYPFATMEVGQMFFLEGKKVENFATYAAGWGRDLNRKFVCRQVFMKRDAKGNLKGQTNADDPNAVSGVGVFRIEDPKVGETKEPEKAAA